MHMINNDLDQSSPSLKCVPRGAYNIVFELILCLDQASLDAKVWVCIWVCKDLCMCCILVHA